MKELFKIIVLRKGTTIYMLKIIKIKFKTIHINYQHDYAIGIWDVTSIDGMTSDWARIPYEVLDKISVRLFNKIKGVNRVLYDISSKPSAKIE